jgi:hypothetical protein
MNLCEKCGKNMDIHGRVHHCVPQTRTHDKDIQGVIEIDHSYKHLVSPTEVPPTPKQKLLEKKKEVMARLGHHDCPVCEARRKLKALQMRRYREKKNA